MIAGHIPDTLAIAHSTLVTGCEFILRCPAPVIGRPASQRRLVQNRVIANRLRELDCFLTVLLEELAAHIEGASHDIARFTRLSNSAKKLRALERMAGFDSKDDAWLRAFCGMAVSLRRTSTALPPVLKIVDGNPFVPLPKIAEFYRNLGDRLMAQTVKSTQVIDFLSVVP